MTQGSTDRFVFFERACPSANMVLVRGERPVLVDPGYGADLPATERLLRGAGTPPENLDLIFNSHFHCDHAGANSGLQRRYGVPVAAHRWRRSSSTSGTARRAAPSGSTSRWSRTRSTVPSPKVTR